MNDGCKYCWSSQERITYNSPQPRNVLCVTLRVPVSLEESRVVKDFGTRAAVNGSGKPKGHRSYVRTLVGPRIQSLCRILCHPSYGPTTHSIDCSSHLSCLYQSGVPWDMSATILESMLLLRCWSSIADSSLTFSSRLKACGLWAPSTQS